MKKLLSLIIGLVIFVPFYAIAQTEELEPVVIVPGITGSWNFDLFIRNINNQEAWSFFPFDRTWDNMILALEDAGYELSENLFIAFYDWRQSNINSVTDYLIPTIDRALENSPTDKINIVAHSMGGLLARRYVQSDDYRGDVNKLIMLGTPNLGSADVYVLWAGGNVPDGWSKINKFMASRYIDYLTLKTPDVTDRFDAVRIFIPSVRELLPIYDFLEDSAGNIKNYWTLADTNNPFLENLRDSAYTLSEVDLGGIVTIAGKSEPTVEYIPFVDRESSETKLWADGKPEPITPVPNSTEGDNRVMLSSALLHQFDIEPQLSLNPNIFQKFFAWFAPKVHADLDWDTFLMTKEIESNHGNLPTISIPDVFEALSLEQPAIAYVPPAEPDNIVSFWFASPVQVSITDPQGYVITKDSNEIPGAVYMGEIDPNGVKIVLIENALAGDYKIELTGSGNGEYHILSSVTSDEFDETTTTQDNIVTGEKHEYTVEISTTEAVAPKVSEPTITPLDPSEDSCSLDDLIARIKERINSSNLNEKAKINLFKRLGKFEEKLDKRNIDADKLCEIFKKYIDKRDSKGKKKTLNDKDFSSLLGDLESNYNKPASKDKLGGVKNLINNLFKR